MNNEILMTLERYSCSHSNPQVINKDNKMHRRYFLCDDDRSSKTYDLETVLLLVWHCANRDNRESLNLGAIYILQCNKMDSKG